MATSIFLIGWATGGLLFGVLGDRMGRVRTMLLTILLYSLFTGLSSFSLGLYDFCFYRFLTGLGVGGEFAVGVALLAEVMPDRARPFTLGMLQAFSAIGNVTACLVYIGMAQLEMVGQFDHWRRGLRADERLETDLPDRHRARRSLPCWCAPTSRSRNAGKIAAVKEGGTAAVKNLGSLRSELFRDPRWSRHALLGMCLAFAGVVGLWGIAFFSVDLVKSVFTKAYRGPGACRAREPVGRSQDLGGHQLAGPQLRRLPRHLRLSLGA